MYANVFNEFMKDLTEDNPVVDYLEPRDYLTANSTRLLKTDDFDGRTKDISGYVDSHLISLTHVTCDC